MSDVDKFIESGILEMYVLGQVTTAEVAEVEHMRSIYDEVNREIEEISSALEGYARASAVEPDPLTGPFLMAKIDYMERMMAGEPPSFPPSIHNQSKITDYNAWIDRADLEPTAPVEDVLIKIIGSTPQMTTAIVWLEHGTPPEIHTNELEQFLILEGSCDIFIEDELHQMKKGDVLIIPLHKTHYVNVTSAIPCKIILQRQAA